MKLLSLLLLLFSVNSFAEANVEVIDGKGLMSVYNLHCKVIPGSPDNTTGKVMERIDSTVLSTEHTRLHIVGLEEGVLELDHNKMSAAGCDEDKVGSILSSAHSQFGHTTALYKVVKTKELIKTRSGLCFESLIEELNATFTNGITLKSTEYKRVELPECCLLYTSPSPRD